MDLFGNSRESQLLYRGTGKSERTVKNNKSIGVESPVGVQSVVAFHWLGCHSLIGSINNYLLLSSAAGEKPSAGIVMGLQGTSSSWVCN